MNPCKVYQSTTSANGWQSNQIWSRCWRSPEAELTEIGVLTSPLVPPISVFQLLQNLSWRLRDGLAQNFVYRHLRFSPRMSDCSLHAASRLTFLVLVLKCLNICREVYEIRRMLPDFYSVRLRIYLPKRGEVSIVTPSLPAVLSRTSEVTISTSKHCFGDVMLTYRL